MDTQGISGCHGAMVLWEILEQAEERFGDRPALGHAGSGSQSWRAVARSTRLRAARLAGLGIDRSDRLALLADNSPEFLETAFAAAGLGAVLVPINTRLATLEVRAILAAAGASLLLYGPGFEHTGAELEEAGVRAEPMDGALSPGSSFEPVRTGPDEVAQLYFTSGTTGKPKGVPLTHGNIAAHTTAVIGELDITEHDVWAHIAPMFHLADAWAVFAITRAGGRHVTLRRFGARAALDCFERDGITLSNLIPTMLNLMVKEEGAQQRGYPSLRMMLSGGAPIAPEVVRAILATFQCEYVQTYGMTETCPYVTLGILGEEISALSPEERLEYLCKAGRPFATVDLRVVDENGRPVTQDGLDIGEIQVRGPTVTPGYWNDPEETRRAFTTDGYLRTGDLATLDAHGFVDIVDRRKDVILTGGETVYSIEVENALYRHPAVLEAAVFGRPHDTWGEQVTAAIVLRPEMETDEASLLACCRRHLSDFKCPKQIEFLPSLPRTGSGKIAKRLLR